MAEKQSLVSRAKTILRRGKIRRMPTIPLNDPRAAAKLRLPKNRITSTKYTLITFIPKNLFEQFRRATNCYFLLIVIITLIPAISPLNPWTSILPLIFVLGVAAIKEGYEDFQRYKADATVNNRKYEVVAPDGSSKTKKSDQLKAGDMIRVYNDQYFPSDIVPLLCSHPEGEIMVETAQLDGETNLKTYRCPSVTAKLSESDILGLRGSLKAEPPTVDLYKFNGTLEIEGQDDFSLSKEHLLLRGAQQRNTEWVLGVVCYTGRYTKLSLNSKLPPSKFSTVERRMNWIVIVLFGFTLFCLIIIVIFSGFWNANYGTSAWYLKIENGPTYQAIKDFFSYLALLSFLIPMSLMVTLEVVKVFQAWFMEWDEKMAMDPNDVPNTGMIAKTSNLNDELALTCYVFSDKTGTLTQNKMVFQQCCINGTTYTHAGTGELLEELNNGSENSKGIDDFLTIMSVCHSVQPALTDEGELKYNASSPDEVALANAGKVNGYVFKSKTATGYVVDIRGEEKEFEVLCEMEFTSTRAMMSNIVRYPDGRIRLLSKGADSKMAQRLKGGQDDFKNATMDQIQKFSEVGLRTLIVGYKDISEEEWNQFHEKHLAASTSMEGREEKVAAVNDSIERDLTLVGATAIEDKLQEEVPETIHNLLRAGIKVWMITGDKQATAINIGYSCRLLKQDMDVIIVNATDKDSCGEQLRAKVNEFCKKDRKRDIALVIDGETLKYALEDHPDEFLAIASICFSVVCCRVSPLQKALIVKLMKKYTRRVCLAIGDGANDVSMIQEAQIGVGIFGLEGTQAARSADYAIREFRSLRRLITVHGRYSFIRNTGLIQYSFYKNCAVFLVQFWFAFYCGYSATTIYDDWIVTLFNIIFTSGPIFFYAIIEKDIDEDIIDEYPEAFRRIQTGYCFTYASLFMWQITAIWHSLIFFFGTVLILAQEPFTYDGTTTGIRYMGNQIASIAIPLVILKVALMTSHWTILNFIAIFGSVLVYYAVLLIESVLPTIFPTQYFIFMKLFSNPNFYFIFLLTAAVCYIPEITVDFLRRQLFPEDWMILQEVKKYKKVDKLREEMGLDENGKYRVENSSTKTDTEMDEE